MTKTKLAVAFVVLALAVLGTYSNHFHNSFHFDDFHTIVDNPYIRDLHNLPHFFADARKFSVNPPTQMYRPMLSASLALDYWMGRGLNPLWFHISTFCWYIVLLGLILVLYRRAFDLAEADPAKPDPRNAWMALFATALFGLHPVMAETVNYIMQRGDLYSTLGVVVGLLVYICAPGLRRYGIYLIPVVIGLLSKEPAAVFPAILFMWVWLYEENDFRKALVRCIPAGVVVGPLALFVIWMMPPSFAAGASSAFYYRISQPAVLLTYFRKFFAPFGLSADTDRASYTSLLQPEALLGFLFVGLLIAAILWLRRHRHTRPIAFGFAWFLIVSMPTSWVGLGEIENDHRMFFPFVGLALSVCCALNLWLRTSAISRPVQAAAALLILANCAWYAHERNRVWHTEESLWLDVTLKSPNNGRGLMNYGLNQMAQGHYEVALDYFQRALPLAPNYPTLEINLGVVLGAMNRASEAELHFKRAIQLNPADAKGYWFYGRWLKQMGRLPEAIVNLKSAVEKNPALTNPRHLLMQVYAAQSSQSELRALAAETLALFPGDTEARDWLAKANQKN